MDHRNALSPWWYIAARPLIDSVPAAPLILHLLVGLFVGVAAYLLLVELTRSRSFALSVGILSALFLPNVYRDEVIWNFVGALGCTLLSIWLFALFCKDRRKNGYLAASYHRLVCGHQYLYDPDRRDGSGLLCLLTRAASRDALA